jgi:uncharacterized protein (TIGR02099 family)
VESLRKLFRRLRTLIWTALTLVILTAAVLVGIGKLLMPYSVQYKPQLEAWLSKEFNQPVELDGFTGEWKAFGPRISLEGLNLLGEGPGEGEIAIQHAALDIKPLNWLISGRPLYTFRIIGADLSLVRNADGRFELSGLGVSGRGGGQGSGLSNLARVGEVRLEGSSLSFDDDQQNIHVQLIEMRGALQMDDKALAMEVQASVSDRRGIRVLGDLGATILVTLDDDQRLADARWHLETGELMISEFGKQLPAHDLKPMSGWLNAELWGSWERGEAQVMEGVLDMREVRLDTDEGLLELDHLNSRFKWRWHDRRQWRLDLADVQVEETGRNWASERISVERNLAGGVGIWVSADYLEAEFPLLVTHQAMATFNARWPKAVPRKGSGTVRDFDLIINDDKKLAICSGTFEDLDVYDWGKFPQLAGLSGSADMAFGEGTILASGTDVRVDWQRNFSAPAVVDIPHCEVEFTWGGSWQVDVRDCAVQNDAISVWGRTRVAGNEGKPAIDINMVVDRAQLDALDDYWPQSIMKPAVTGWLSRGLVAGEVTSAHFTLSGDMDDWPFRGNQGSLAARVELNGAILDYHPGWPAARGVDAVARFEGVGLQVEGSVANVGGAPLARASARIRDFQAPVLELDYATTAELSELAGFIEASPLLENSRLDLQRFEFEGGANIEGRLEVPLKAGGGELAVEGLITLAGNRFTELDSQVRLEGLGGTLRYDQDGFSGTQLEALWTGFPGRLELAADWDAEQLFRADLAGSFPVEVLIGETPLRDDPLLAAATGVSDWEISFTVTDPQGQEEADIWLDLASDLQGVVLDLPNPLHKPADASWPLTFRYPIKAVEPVMRASLGQDVEILVDDPGASEGPARAAVGLGGEPASLPGNGLFSIQGSADEFDLDQWMDVIIDYFASELGPNSLVFGDAGLHAGRLLFLNREFADVAMQARYEEEVLHMHFDSEEMLGEVRYARNDDGAHSLAAEMERLLLPDPVDQGMTMDTNPAELPEMHLIANQFRYLGLDMGETRIEAYPLANGLRIESIEAVSPQMNFQARGDWIITEEGARSDFDIVMTSESLGALVEALDLSSVLEGGQTMIRYDAWWTGPPAAFALSALNGEMSFSVVDGRILNADPGAGRVLGLMSLTALPRRLAFDFRDVFESGFSFDQARGTLKLENGTARTDDFILESTVANLTVVGSSNLVEQLFDYEMSVRPGVSQVLPVVGALAAGPAGAAAGLALQGLFKNALGEAAEARYSVTGPWSDPEISRLQAPPRTDIQPIQPTEGTAADD